MKLFNSFKENKQLINQTLWGVLDFLLIFGLAFLAWALYLVIEMILVWIFAGFKSDKNNNGK